MNKKNSNQVFPEKMFAEVSVRSKGGKSIFSSDDYATSENVENYLSTPTDIAAAEKRLIALGFEVLAKNEIGLSIAGTVDLFESVFKTKIHSEERLLNQGVQTGETKTTTCFDSENNNGLTGFIDPSNSELADVIEGIAINEPVEYFANPFPPVKNYWHLDVPSGVSLGVNADKAHRRGYSGKKVKVVMVDSGWYKHPFFTSRGYKSLPVALGPSATNPTRDENGHGTGESANVFSVAPDVTFQMVKINFVNSIGAFNKAVSLKPSIISCSWGKSLPTRLSAADRMMAAAIANAVRKGIIVIFSAGNGHYGFPGQHPDVISAGGAYMLPNGRFTASNYASGFNSRIYRNRLVPDVCGLVGMKPRAQYIMLPVEPNDALDRGLSGGNHPNGDETSAKDGWAAFSGTSAAAPQIAGICALMKQANPRLTPKLAKAILKKTARDVKTGVNAMGNRARTGIDNATGHGLADAYRATLLARWYYILPSIIRPRPVLPMNETVDISISEPESNIAFETTNGNELDYDYLADMDNMESIIAELEEAEN